MGNKYDVIVIGGGAAGMMAAAIASRNKKVLLLEKNNELGLKLRISGGGRCNITNAQFNIGLMLKNYGTAQKYLYSPFSIFGVEDTFTFFKDLGLPLTVEESGKAFPQTQKAFDVYKVLLKELQKNKVEIRTNCKVHELRKDKKRIIYAKTSQGRFNATSYILSTGGISHPETGSTGDGFKWLQTFGHHISNPSVTIVPLKTKEEWVKKSSGVSLKNAKITFFQNGKKSFSENGPILFTHFGLSGPTILNSSSKVNYLLQSGNVEAHIDLYPNKQINVLEDELLELFNKNSNKMLKNVLKEFLPPGVFGPIELMFPEINFDIQVNSLNKPSRKLLLNAFKEAHITITGLMGKDMAVAADGGIALDEVDMKTMKSKSIENLFVVGDLLHINRPSGGYSLQLCWTSGYVAGISA